ncbi:MAG: hypothetical protein HYS07_10275 [Chlamydiae bacterium]|nr:hypothetical protein [Chlamydiota bacterium]MBI3277052.1 hypothetical protein [Chlamydiota bacterium]
MICSRKTLKNGLRRTLGGILIGLGWILSPLTWWNDWFINLPLSWLLAGFVARQDQAAFGKYFIFFYWFTNLLGFLLMYLGWRFAFFMKKVSRREIFISFSVSLLYTGVIWILVKFEILKPLF